MIEAGKFEKLPLHFDGKHLNASGKKVRDGLSAVMRIKNDLWLACDESVSIERLTLMEDGSFGKHKSFRLMDYLDLPVQDKVEVDIEGLSFCDSYLWLIGSHSLKRKKVKFEKGGDNVQLKRLAKVSSDPNRYIIGRIPLAEDQEQKGSMTLVKSNDQNSALNPAQLVGDGEGNLLTDFLKEDKHLRPFMAIPGKDNGFDIEGLAVQSERMFIGLRGPVLRGWTIILEIEFDHAENNRLTIRQKPGRKYPFKKYFLNLNGLGIRELCIDSKDILILAGPTMELSSDMALFRWNNGIQSKEEVIRPEKMSYLLSIPHHQGFDKAEGLKLFMDEGGQKKLIVVYDTPAHERKFGSNSVYADLVDI